VLPYGDGYLLRSYTPGEPDGSGRCIDTIVCDIYGYGNGSTLVAVDSAYDMLHALKRALAQVRDWPQAGAYRPPHYVYFQPLNAAWTSYSIIHGGSVSAPGADYLSTKGVLSDVVVTVIREPFWRDQVPYSVTDKGASWSMNSLGFWGAAGITMNGDLPSLVSIVTQIPSQDLYRTLFLSYRSQLLNPRDYNQSMTEEAELWPTMGADTASQANGLASNNAVARCTFTTNAGNVMRCSTQSSSRRGTYRIFARLWCDSGTSVNCYLQRKHHAGTAKGNTVNVTYTGGHLYDLGAFQFTKDPAVPDVIYGYAAQQVLEFYAQRVSGSGGMYIDCFIMMPCDEGFLRFSNPSPISTGSDYVYVYDTTMGRETFATQDYLAAGAYGPGFRDPAGPVNGAGRMAFQPGAGQIQMLFAYNNYEQDFNASGFGISPPKVRAVPCYNSPRGYL
jgi:hypothetical protein